MSDSVFSHLLVIEQKYAFGFGVNKCVKCGDEAEQNVRIYT